MTIPLLRTSERIAFKNCQQSWWWSYIEGLKLTGAEAMALWFGTGMHLVMAEYYIPGTKRGRDMHDTWDEYCDGEAGMIIRLESEHPDGEATFIDAIELGHLMIDGYLAEYGDDAHMDVIAPEQRFSALIPHPKRPHEAIADLRGTFDLVYRDLNDGQLKLMDHKNVKQIILKHLMLDDQAGGYVTVADIALRDQGLIKPNEQITEITYNFLRKAKPDLRTRDSKGRFRNKPTKKQNYIDALTAEFEYTDDEVVALGKMTLAKLAQEASDYGVTVYGDISANQGSPRFVRESVPRTPKEKRRQVLRLGEDMIQMNAVRQGKLPVTKNPGQHCSWCQFVDLCELDESGGDTDDFKKMFFAKKDPYADHRSESVNSKVSLLDRKQTEE